MYERINSLTIFIYCRDCENEIKRRWFWSSDIEKIKKFFNKEIKGIEEMLDKVGSVIDLKKCVSIVNKKLINKKFYVYSNVNRALNQVKKNGGIIYIDKNKTFREDCWIDI